MTPLLIPPSLEEVKAQAKKIDLAEDEAELFFCHYSSQGWKVGKNPMKSWTMALRGWQIRCNQKKQERNNGGFRGVQTTKGPSIVRRDIIAINNQIQREML